MQSSLRALYSLVADSKTYPEPDVRVDVHKSSSMGPMRWRDAAARLVVLFLNEAASTPGPARRRPAESVRAYLQRLESDFADPLGDIGLPSADSGASRARPLSMPTTAGRAGSVMGTLPGMTSSGGDAAEALAAAAAGAVGRGASPGAAVARPAEVATGAHRRPIQLTGVSGRRSFMGAAAPGGSGGGAGGGTAAPGQPGSSGDGGRGGDPPRPPLATPGTTPMPLLRSRSVMTPGGRAAMASQATAPALTPAPSRSTVAKIAPRPSGARSAEEVSLLIEAASFSEARWSREVYEDLAVALLRFFNVLNSENRRAFVREEQTALARAEASAGDAKAEAAHRTAAGAAGSGFHVAAPSGFARTTVFGGTALGPGADSGSGDERPVARDRWQG